MVRVEAGETILFGKCSKYRSRKRLYELEKQLGKQFMQISKSTLVNLSYLESIEAGFNGTLLLKLKNGCKDYVSRKYLPGRVVCLGSVLGISCGGSEQSVLLYVSFCPIEEDSKVLHPPPNRLGGFRPDATLQSRSQHLTAQASCPAPEVILPCSPESFLSDCGASTAPVQKG